MNLALSNPFCFAGDHQRGEPVAASSVPTSPEDAADGPFDGPDIPMADLVARGFDADAFVSDCEPLPAFLVAPSLRYLSATDIFPILRTLAGH